LAIFRELGDRWGIAGTLADLGNMASEERNYLTARTLYQQSLKLFLELDHKRGIARLLECFACVAVGQLEADRALRLARAATALRQNIGAPLTPAEQSKLEAALDLPRQTWQEGLALPIEKAIEEVLTPGNPSSSN